ncbi:MAG: purine-nucleoside phosphorylase [Mycoplasma sp.]|nr:purine-nucleoside phosphorylase [Mycoplasma sp.]
MTPHINAKKNEIAKTVLMPGDPLRAKFIAEKFLENVKHVNSVRNMFMYTGTYKGKEITIAGSGMGQPSIGIYAFELFKFYDVENIIRIGSAGSYEKDLAIYDVILADDIWSDTTFAKYMIDEDIKILKPSMELNEKIKKSAETEGIEIKTGRIHSSDVFYSSENWTVDRIVEMTGGARCVEMESFALAAVAKRLNKKATCLLTISDNLITKEETSPEERQTAFTKMMKIALGTVLID